MPSISDEQIRQAKSVDILTYLQAYEPHNLIKQGHDRYVLRDHDSFVISNGSWCWNSRGYGRNSATALAYLIDVRGLDFTDAVQRLLEGNIHGVSRSELPPPKTTLTVKPPKPFTLPPGNQNNDHAIAYLRGRGIDKDIIMSCIKAGTLYESERSSCVFVGFNGDTPRFACERSISGNIKKDVSGSDKRYGFVLPPNDPNSRNLTVTESPIDTLAHASIHKMDGDKWDGYRLSLGGVSFHALIAFLELHPETDHVWLCLDGDKAGKEATIRIIRELLTDERFSRIKITVTPPPLGKDYADTLGAVLQLNKEKSQPDRHKQAVNFI